MISMQKDRVARPRPGGRSGRIITLLTDFGLRDPYVGIMKGVIAGIAPAVKMIDLTHDIPPQDIRAAGFSLLNAYPYFPAGTVHLAVVDPGVGTPRRAVAVDLEDALLVGPDNGIFTALLQTRAVKRAVSLTRREYWLTPNPGFTFHGRDILAPVAAHLASGESLSRVGTPVDPSTLVHLELSKWIRTAEGVSGCIQYVDTFGNLVTNIPGHLVEGTVWRLEAAVREIPGCRTYAEAAPGALLALVGSHGFIEIAVNHGNAQTLLSLGVDDPVAVLFPGGRESVPDSGLSLGYRDPQ